MSKKSYLIVFDDAQDNVTAEKVSRLLGLFFRKSFISLTSAAELLRAPAEPEQKCPLCRGQGSYFDNEDARDVCPLCHGRGFSNRSGRG